MKSYLKRNGAWLGFLLLALIITVATDGSFVSSRNISNLMRQASINGILAGGMTLVILTGGIDLSIGSLVALCGIVVGISQVNWGWANEGFAAAWMSVGLSLAAGILGGAITGGLIAGLRIAPFIVTLGVMVTARGLALILSDGASISPMGEGMDLFANAYLPMWLTYALSAAIFAAFAFRAYKNGRMGLADLVFPFVTFALISYSFVMYRGFPVLGLFLLAVLSILGFLLTQTTFGRSIYAFGSNEKAAFWAGVPLKRVTILVYTIMGALAGLAGLLLTSRLNGADPNAGQLFELDAIAAVVIGGTSLKGGQGSIIGSFVGALMIATLNNGMDLLGVTSFYQMVFKGLIIVIAVSLDQGQRQAA